MESHARAAINVPPNKQNGWFMNMVQAYCQARREGGGTGASASPHGMRKSASRVHLLWTDGSNKNFKTKLAGVD